MSIAAPLQSTSAPAARPRARARRTREAAAGAATGVKSSDDSEAAMSAFTEDAPVPAGCARGAAVRASDGQRAPQLARLHARAK